MNSIDSKAIVELLRVKHAKDVFVSECKDGPSQFGGHRRLDGWVMERSWANPRVIGYEVKISRSDFLQDDKWQDYLGLCNQLYFVCPNGMIKPEEVPASVGLMYVSKTKTVLFRKKKADFRNPTIPESLYRYILMCRARIAPPGLNNDSDCETSREENLRAWIQRKDERAQLSWEVNKKIREIVDSVREENRRLKRDNETAADVLSMLKEMGIRPEHASRHVVRREIEKRRFGVAQEISYAAKSMEDAIKRFSEALVFGNGRLEKILADQEAEFANGTFV